MVNNYIYKMYKFVDITPPKLTKPDNQPQDILPADNAILIVGRMGSGKTYLIDQILKNKDLWFRKFDAIYFIGPSPIPLVNAENRDTVLSVQPDLEWMMTKCELWNQKCKAKKEKGNILFIMDDVLAQMAKLAFNEEFKTLFWNRRHKYENLIISYIFTAQYARAFPRAFRSCVNTLIAFSMSEEDWRVISKDCMFTRTKEQEHMIPIHLEKPHNFVTIRCDTGSVFLNFSEVV
jgi:hypothetical protein